MGINVRCGGGGRQVYIDGELDVHHKYEIQNGSPYVVRANNNVCTVVAHDTAVVIGGNQFYKYDGEQYEYIGSLYVAMEKSAACIHDDKIFWIEPKSTYSTPHQKVYYRGWTSGSGSYDSPDIDGEIVGLVSFNGYLYCFWYDYSSTSRVYKLVNGAWSLVTSHNIPNARFTQRTWTFVVNENKIWMISPTYIYVYDGDMTISYYTQNRNTSLIQGGRISVYDNVIHCCYYGQIYDFEGGTWVYKSQSMINGGSTEWNHMAYLTTIIEGSNYYGWPIVTPIKLGNKEYLSPLYGTFIAERTDNILIASYKVT